MSDYVSPDTAMRFAKVVGSTTAPPPFRIHILDGSGSMRDDWNRPITHRTRWMNATEVAHSIGHEVCYVFGSHIYYGSPKSVRFPCEMTNFNIAFETLLAEIRKIDASAFPLVDIFFHSDGQHTEGKLRLFEDGGILPRIRSVIDDKRLRTRVHIIGYGDSFPVEALCGPIKSQLETHPTEHMLFQVKDGCLVEDLPLEEIIASRQSLFTIPPNIAATGLYGQPVTEANAGTVVLVDGSHLEEEEEAPDSSPNSCGGVSFEPVTNHELMLALQGASKRVLWCIHAKRGKGVVEPFEEILRFAVQSTMGTPRDDDRMTVRESVAARKRGREIGIFADHIRGQIRRLTDDVGRNRILRGREIASLIRCDTSSLLSSRHLDDALRRKGVSNFDRDLALFRSGVARGILASGGGEEVVVSRFSLEGWEDMLHAMMDESFEEADLYKLIGVGIPAMRTSLPDFVKQQPFGLPGSRMFKGIANGTFAYVDVCNLMARMENFTEGYRDPQTPDNPFNAVVLVAEERFKPLFLSNLGRMMTTSSSIELHAAIDLDAHFAQLSCFSLFLLHQPASEWIESMLGRVATTMRFYSERMDAEGNIVENAVMRRYIDALTSADEERTMQALRKKAMWEGIAIEPDVLARLRRKEIRNEDLPEDMRPNPAWSPTLLKPAGVLIAFAERFTPEARKVCLRGMAKAWVHRIWQQNPVHEAWFRLDGSNAEVALNTSVPTLEELGLAGDRLNESADTVSQVPSIIRKEVTRFFSRQGTGYDVKLRNRLNLEAGTASTIYRINLEAGSATTISIPFKDFRKLCEHFDCEEVIEELSVHGLAWLVEASGESRVSICNTIISNMMQSAREEAIAQLSLAGEALWARNHERIHSDELRGMSDGVYPFPSKEAFAGWCSRYGIEDEWDPATGYPKRTCMYCRKTFADRDTFFAHLRGAHVVTDARGRVRRVRQAGAFSSATLCEAFSRALTKFVKERDRIPMTPTSLRKFLAKHYREAVKSVENFKTYAGEDETDESLAQHIQTALQLVA
jgi:hypothetical protein